MGRHGPRGACGCCGAVNCRCPLGCCSGSPPQKVDQIISGFPAYVMRDGVYRVPTRIENRRIKIEISGLDNANGTVLNYAVLGPAITAECDWFRPGWQFDVTVTISFNDTDPTPHTCATPLLETQTSTFTLGTPGGMGGFAWRFGIVGVPWNTPAFTGLAADIASALPEIINFPISVLQQLPPIQYNDSISICGGGSERTDNHIWLNVSGTTCDQEGPVSGNITSSYPATYGPPNTIKAKGIKYTISDLPTEFISRIGASTTVIGVSGLEAFNGTYEIDFTDPDLCTGGTYEEEIEVTIQEYEVSTSSPCTSVPVGYAYTGTATLVLAPTNEEFFTWVIRIEHPYLTGVRIDYIELEREWPAGIHCNGYTDTWDHGDECANNSSPVITVEAEPLFI